MVLVKTVSEIKKIQKAAKITLQIIDKVMKQVDSGATEKEVADAFLEEMKKRNVKPSFPPIVAFGSSATTLHHKPNNTKITKHGFLLLDVGCKVNGYCADISRMFHFGKMTSQERKVLETVITTQQIIFDVLRPGVKAGDVQKIYSDVLKKNGYKVLHSFGHTLGTKPHDSSRLRKNTKLKEGMVITVEPGIYIRRGKQRFGVRIEDDVVITKNGFRKLS
ncbi:hypothetical protein CL614_06365 [archaeon]|nr:hypothetical protein [archaeon]|tara:strand:+ start:2602 stop:3261 length:660 start_codon:yes stop_codon:yes gene_type:complete